MKTFLHIATQTVGAVVVMTTIYQSPQAAARLPYRARNGTVLTALPSGRPALQRQSNGAPLAALRAPNCPEAYWRQGVELRCRDAAEARRYCAAIAAAVREFRGRLRGQFRDPAGVDPALLPALQTLSPLNREA